MRAPKIAAMALLLTACLAQAGRADSLPAMSFDAFSIDVNTADEPQVWIQLTFSEPIDDGSTADLIASSGVLAVLRIGDDTDFREDLIIAVDSDTLFFVSTGSSGTLGNHIERIYDGRARAYVYLDRDIRVVLADGSLAVVRASDVRTFTEGKLELTQAQRDLLAETGISGRLTEDDRIDISREVDNEDSLSSEYVADFHFNQPIFESHFSLGIDGRLSTKKENPLNRMEIYLYRPLTRDSMFESRFVYDLFLEASAKGTQTMDTAILSLKAGVTALTPNLVKLTMGANRLRLKPVFTLGLNYVRHLRKQAIYGHTSESFEATLNLFYYIPVADKFALIYIGEGSYNNKRRIDDRLNMRNSIAFAYDLPFEDLKAIFKWETGKNEFMTESESQALIGLLMNYINF